MFGRLPISVRFPRCWPFRKRFEEFAILVDLQELLGHVVVEAIVHDEVDAYPNGLIEKTFFCE